MPNYFYFSCGNDTLILDSNVTSFNIGAIKRSFDFQKFSGSHGGTISGAGDISERTFTISRKERSITGGATFWNTRRLEYLAWFLRNANEIVYLNILDATGTYYIRTRVYCTNIGAEKVKHFGSTDDRDITLISPTGYFEKTTAVNSDTFAGNNDYGVLTIAAVQGILEVPFIWTFHPNEPVSTIKIWTAESNGFHLEFSPSFADGKTIIYNNVDNSLTINGISYDVNNYLVKGNRFNVPVSTTEISFYVSAEVDISYSYYPRYI